MNGGGMPSHDDSSPIHELEMSHAHFHLLLVAGADGDGNTLTTLLERSMLTKTRAEIHHEKRRRRRWRASQASVSRL